MDSNLSCIYDITDDVCSPALKNNNDKSNNSHTQSNNQQWFDSECGSSIGSVLA